MSILKYNDYISEKAVYSLLLESKLVFSKKFIGFLSRMKNNLIAKELINLYSKDIEIQHNYVDIGKEKDVVTFTPDRRVQELEKDKPQTYTVIDEGRYLTHKDSNNGIFGLLGYAKPDGDPWSPENGVVGLILKECVSPVSGKIFVWFKGTGENEGKETVMNKEGLADDASGEYSKIWTVSRNNIKVGRLVRAILTSAGKTFIDKDIEEFVNQYKSVYDMAANALARFDIVEGDKIAHWYNHNQYVDEGGVLGNSCMASVSSKYFDIYVNNPEVCKLVILYDENGSITDGVYKSNKITGRCLLWTANEVDRQGNPMPSVQIMDRIYTNKDSDVELFKQFGQSKGFYWKNEQDSDNDFTMCNGTTQKAAGNLVISVKLWSFDRYPYMDTFFYLTLGERSSASGQLSNSRQGHDRSLRSTGGGYDGHDYDDEDDDYDDDDN